MQPPNRRVQSTPLCGHKIVGILKSECSSVVISTYLGGAADAQHVGPHGAVSTIQSKVADVSMRSTHYDQWQSVFIVMGPDLDPIQASQQFKQQPSAAWRSGDLHPTLGTVYGYGSCVFDLPSQYSAGDPSDQLLQWCNLLEASQTCLEQWQQQKFETFIECQLYTHSMTSFNLSARLLARLARLNVEIQVEIYPEEK
jgi:hypothetical protein